MTIERINGVDQISKFKKTENNTKISKDVEKDSVNISEEALEKAKFEAANNIAKSAPVIRKDRVEEVKKKLEDPSYINDKIIESVAEQIMKHFEI